MTRLGLLLAAALVGLGACSKAAAPIAAANFPTVQLNDAVGDQLGGPDTCVVMLDAATGAVLYQYGLPSVCNRPLPPCATFDAPSSLIGLDAGLVTPATVLKWDGKPQPVTAWEKDADMATAFRQSNGWWFQALAAQVGVAAYRERLKAYGYGRLDAGAPAGQFWMGPSQGGGLTISTRDQADFIQRLYAGRLPAKAAAAAAVQTMMADETRGAASVAGKAGSCDTASDGSRSVGWWVGRLASPDRNLVFAVSIEGQNVFPGFEIASRMKAVFADAGLWPAQ